MTLQELNVALSKMKTLEDKKVFISNNLTHNTIVELLIESVTGTNTVEPVVVSPYVYDKLISLIEDNFRKPDGKGRGRKAIINDDTLSFWDKVRKIKSGTTSTYLKQNMLAKLLERETVIREENGIPVTDCIEHIMSAKLIEIDELEKKDKQLIQQVDDENSELINNN